MRIIFLFILFVIHLNSKAQQKNPYAALKFDKVIMYDFEGGKEGDIYIIDDKGQLAKSISKQVVINKAIIDNLNSKLGNKKSFGGGTAACFDPHVGFVYYLKNKIVAHLSICLDCNRLYSSTGNLPAQQQGKVGKGKDAYYLGEGMSKFFRRFINNLLIKYKFSHQITPGSDFDK